MNETSAARERPADILAGFLASAAIFASLIGVAYRPVRLIPFALVLALVAGAMGERYGRLAALAVWVASVAFVVGMTMAVLTSNPLY